MKYLSIDIHYSMSVKILSKLCNAIPVRIENYAFPICPSACEHVHQGLIYNESPRGMSRQKEGRSPNRWAEKEASKCLQGDVFALHHGAAFKRSR